MYPTITINSSSSSSNENCWILFCLLNKINFLWKSIFSSILVNFFRWRSTSLNYIGKQAIYIYIYIYMQKSIFSMDHRVFLVNYYYYCYYYYYYTIIAKFLSNQGRACGTELRFTVPRFVHPLIGVHNYKRSIMNPVVYILCLFVRPDGQQFWLYHSLQ